MGSWRGSAVLVGFVMVAVGCDGGGSGSSTQATGERSGQGVGNGDGPSEQELSDRSHPLLEVEEAEGAQIEAWGEQEAPDSFAGVWGIRSWAGSSSGSPTTSIGTRPRCVARWPQRRRPQAYLGPTRATSLARRCRSQLCIVARCQWRGVIRCQWRSVTRCQWSESRTRTRQGTSTRRGHPFRPRGYSASRIGPGLRAPVVDNLEGAIESAAASGVSVAAT